MDKVIELAKTLRQEIDKLPLFQEYSSLSRSVEENEELKELKTQIVRAKNENRLDEHKLLIEKYNSHPLIVNLNALKEDVQEYLKEISDILNEK